MWRQWLVWMPELLWIWMRETLEQIETEDIDVVFDEIQSSTVMENLWKAYQRNYSYSADIPWHIVMESVRYLYQTGCSAKLKNT